MIIYALDDETLLLNSLVRAIKEASPTSEVHSFSYGQPLLDELQSCTSKPSVAFLDIELPGMNGIEVAKRIKILSPSTWIIFVTGFDSFAVDAYKIHAKGFITKPVTAKKIKEELTAAPCVPLSLTGKEKLKVRTFGHFEAYCDGVPLKFRYSKTKELLAYLVDRRGAGISSGELIAILYEDECGKESIKSQFRNLVVDLKNVLSEHQIMDVLIHEKNSYAVDESKIDCDLYRFLKEDKEAINSYSGEYMVQYSWADFGFYFDK